MATFSSSFEITVRLTDPRNKTPFTSFPQEGDAALCEESKHIPSNCVLSIEFLKEPSEKPPGDLLPAVAFIPCPLRWNEETKEWAPFSEDETKNFFVISLARALFFSAQLQHTRVNPSETTSRREETAAAGAGIGSSENPKPFHSAQKLNFKLPEEEAKFFNNYLPIARTIIAPLLQKKGYDFPLINREKIPPTEEAKSEDPITDFTAQLRLNDSPYRHLKDALIAKQTPMFSLNSLVALQESFGLEKRSFWARRKNDIPSLKKEDLKNLRLLTQESALPFNPENEESKNNDESVRQWVKTLITDQQIVTPNFRENIVSQCLKNINGKKKYGPWLQEAMISREKMLETIQKHPELIQTYGKKYLCLLICALTFPPYRTQDPKTQKARSPTAAMKITRDLFYGSTPVLNDARPQLRLTQEKSPDSTASTDSDDRPSSPESEGSKLSDAVRPSSRGSIDSADSADSATPFS